MLGFLSKLLGGSKSEKDVKKIQPIVKSINEYFEGYSSLSNDELQGALANAFERIVELEGLWEGFAEAIAQYDRMGKPPRPVD